MEEEMELLHLYPNPTTSLLYLDMPTEVQAERVLIFAANGVLMTTYIGKDVAQQLDVSQLSAGIYYLRVETAERVYTQKFIKQ